MAEFPSMPLWTGDYLADTQDLSAEEHGVYMLLLMAQWRSPDCTLPDDDQRLSRMAKVGLKKWRKLRPRVMEILYSRDGIPEQAHNLRPEVAARFIEIQRHYTRAQREMAVSCRHLLYVVPKRRPLPDSLRKAIYARDNALCSYCGSYLPSDDFTIDHVRAVANGGTDDEGNLVTACRRCNARKGAQV